MGRHAVARSIVVIVLTAVAVAGVLAIDPITSAMDPVARWILVALVAGAVVLIAVGSRQEAATPATPAAQATSAARADAAAPPAPAPAAGSEDTWAGTVGILTPQPMRGRERELARLRTLHGARGRRFAVVRGVRGAGSSTLVARFAAEADAPASWIWFSTPSALRLELTGLAIHTGLSQEAVEEAVARGRDADLVWRHLATITGLVLVVDGVRSPADLDGPIGERGGWLRPLEDGLLVVTTSEDDGAGDPRGGAGDDVTAWGRGAELVRVAPLPDRAGAAALRDAADRGTRAHAGPGDHGPDAGPDARALARRLGNLPLALRLAGRTIAASTGPLRDTAAYVRALDERLPDGAPARPDASDPAVARELVRATVGIALDQLAAAGAVEARPVLRLLSLLADAPVPRSLLTPALLRAATGRETTDYAIDAAIAGLRRHALLDDAPCPRVPCIAAVTLRPVVRAIVAADLDDDRVRFRAALDERITAVVAELASTVRADWDTAEHLTPHLATLGGLAAPGPAFDAAQDVVEQLDEVLGRGGRAAASLLLAEDSLAAHDRVLGPDHRETVAARVGVATAYGGVGRLDESIALIERDLGPLERAFGPDHDHTTTTRNNLAHTYRHAGRPADAIAVYEPNVAATERAHGPDHERSIVARNNLGHAYQHAGRAADAIAIHEPNVATSERALGADHPHTLTCRRGLALAYLDAGRVAEAVVLLEAALADTVRVLGPDHGDTTLAREQHAAALAAAHAAAPRRGGP